MRKFLINVNGKSYDVEVEEIRNGAPVAQAPKATGTAGSVKVEAPMPGNVLKVNVKVGDTVAEGQTLAVLEAMKMENDIVAPCDGTIKSINTPKGASVNTDDVLAVI